MYFGIITRVIKMESNVFIWTETFINERVNENGIWRENVRIFTPTRQPYESYHERKNSKGIEKNQEENGQQIKETAKLWLTTYSAVKDLSQNRNDWRLHRQDPGYLEDPGTSHPKTSLAFFYCSTICDCLTLGVLRAIKWRNLISYKWIRFVYTVVIPIMPA